MFKISEFARLSKIPLKTLRYYDQIGILKPKKTDKDTGYRYYSAEQLLDINRIFIYKELGFLYNKSLSYFMKIFLPNKFKECSGSKKVKFSN